jgi:hypothetical protein
MQIGQITYTLYIVVLCFAILMEISWKLTLVSLSVMPALFFYSLAMIRVVRARYRVTDDAEAVVVDAISENLDGVRIVKAYNEESHEIEKFQKKNEIHGKAYRRHTRTSAFFYSSSDIFIFASRVISLVYSVFLAFAGEITVGTIGAGTFIAAADQPGGWLKLEYSTEQERTLQIGANAVSVFYHYAGDKFPRGFTSGYINSQITLSAAFKTDQEEEILAFEALLGRPVIIKHDDDPVIVGKMTAWNKSVPRWAWVSYTINVEQTEWEDFADERS